MRVNLQDLVDDATCPRGRFRLDINKGGDFIGFSLGDFSSQLYVRE